MINIDFSLAVAIFIFLSLSIILASWLITKRENHKNFSLDHRFIWFCSICTYTYINTKDEVISVCPRCGSYNSQK